MICTANPTFFGLSNR